VRPTNDFAREVSLGDLAFEVDEVTEGDWSIPATRLPPEEAVVREAMARTRVRGASFADESTRDTSVGLSTRDAPQITEDGRYQVEEAIGVGGMGRVFRVLHLRLGKRFALKVMRRSFRGNAALRARFFREAKLASSLAHPNIVSVIDFGEDLRLGGFMVMELLEGESLSHRLRRDGPLNLRAACEILLEVADALHHIHLRGIVHRDVKSENILLCPVPGLDRRKMFQCKLLDFGLAREGDPTGAASDTVEGTPEYMAPESIRGLPPTPATDIYAVGVLAYELLTGRPPFAGPMKEVLRAHVHTPPPPPSSRMKEPLDERAEALIMRALAKDPALRQKDMGALVYELRTLLHMLGHGRQRTPGATVKPGAGRPVDRRERMASLAFDQAPFAMASVNVDGTIVVANRAFAGFLVGDRGVDVTAQNIYTSGLLDVCPDISAGIRQVHVEGRPLQRTINLHDKRGDLVRLLVWLMPGAHETGDVFLGIQTVADLEPS
jgi:tRNA A-37 threonylcarbamoyl transferase component Bud32